MNYVFFRSVLSTGKCNSVFSVFLCQILWLSFFFLSQQKNQNSEQKPCNFYHCGSYAHHDRGRTWRCWWRIAFSSKIIFHLFFEIFINSRAPIPVCSSNYWWFVDQITTHSSIPTSLRVDCAVFQFSRACQSERCHTCFGYLRWGMQRVYDTTDG